MMAAGSASTITLGPQKQRRFARRLARWSPRVRSFRLDTMDGARGSANGGVSNLSARNKAPTRAAGTETAFCSRGQKTLTKSRFIRKVNTHFYHARPATCSNRAYKQRVDYP